MSGGVDSSVAAALARERGSEVIGATLVMWTCDLESSGRRARECCGSSDVRDARAVAAAIGIPHEVVDGRAEFVERVAHAARDAQARGLTPNPCVLCNEHLKFGLLLDWARRQGADAVVTGHYAKIEGGALCRAADRAKDQSYFLFTLAGDARLAEIEFPVGGMTKAEVRASARMMGLPVAGKRESQDLCFPVADAGDRPGEVVDLEGRVIGRHSGLSRYTVGQRRGVGVAAGRRLYVVALRPEGNQVVLGDEEDLLVTRVRASMVSWRGDPPERPIEAEVRIRLRHEPAAARVRIEAGGIVADVVEPLRAVTPGQALVVYQGEEILGGGWILGGDQPGMGV